MKSIMEELESGMFDDLINEELRKSEVEMSGTGTQEYLCCLISVLGKNGNQVYSDDSSDGWDEKETDAVSRLPLFYQYLKEIMYFQETEKDENTNHMEFSYKKKGFRISQTYTDCTVIVGIKEIGNDTGKYEELCLLQ